MTPGRIGREGKSDVLLGEPARTPYDLHFRLLGFPIRIHPAFWIVALLMGFYGGDNEPLTVLAFMVAVLVSIIVHELGHALMFRRYRIDSHVVLYHFGGLAVPDSMDSAAGYDRSSRYQQLMVSIAGPLAQLLLAMVVILGLRLGGFTDGVVTHQLHLPGYLTADPFKDAEFFVSQAKLEKAIVPVLVQPETEGKPAQYENAIDLSKIHGLAAHDRRALMRCDLDGNGKINDRELNEGPGWSLRSQFPSGVPSAYLIPNQTVASFVFSLVFVSIFWALLNLMPVYPLDGGQIARELFQLSGTSAAIEKSLMLSIATGVILGLLGFKFGQPMAAFMFLMLAWSSFQTLQRYRGTGGGYRGGW